ncbi:MAG: hypothetical protein ACTHQQ_08350 [Solirubrobacteraceae bacterium]
MASSKRTRGKKLTPAAGESEPGEAKPPAVIPPRSPEEEALLAAHADRTSLAGRLHHPVLFENEDDGKGIRFASPDKALARARLAELLRVPDTVHAGRLLAQTAQASGIKDEDYADAVNLASAMIHGIGPRDPLEALLACQMAATHSTAIEMLRRTHLAEQIDHVDSCVTRAARLMRTFTAQVAALKDYRSKGHQTVTVQHVQVSEGGQAIVGDVVMNQAGRGSGGI